MDGKNRKEDPRKKVALGTTILGIAIGAIAGTAWSLGKIREQEKQIRYLTGRLEKAFYHLGKLEVNGIRKVK